MAHGINQTYELVQFNKKVRKEVKYLGLALISSLCFARLPMKLRLMLAIQKAEASGFVHFAAALKELLKRELRNENPEIVEP